MLFFWAVFKSLRPWILPIHVIDCCLNLILEFPYLEWVLYLKTHEPGFLRTFKTQKLRPLTSGCCSSIIACISSLSSICCSPVAFARLLPGFTGSKTWSSVSFYVTFDQNYLDEWVLKMLSPKSLFPELSWTYSIFLNFKSSKLQRCRTLAWRKWSGYSGCLVTFTEVTKPLLSRKNCYPRVLFPKLIKLTFKLVELRTAQ